MNPTKIRRFFDQRCARMEPLALVTVVETQGSTYSKAGDQMLIDAHGVGCGMLSGGCLESDLVVRAQVVLESGDDQSVTYDLASGDDDIWGLGIGCDGSMTIGLTRITAENDYAPFELPSPIRLLVLGAGLDAIPLTRLADEIGWSCTIADHRPAYVDHAGFPGECEKHCVEATQLAATVDLNTFDCAVVMSHQLASDREYLRQLAEVNISYVGLLGPAARKERLLSELGEHGKQLHGHLHGPAGLNLGGRGPEAIALSIVAQIQQALAQD
jgi:xanthine/CO dehydrogenase XdhC/CoxF family maturation factor